MRFLSNKDRIDTLRDLSKALAAHIHLKHLKTFPKTTWTECPHQDCRRAAKILELTK